MYAFGTHSGILQTSLEDSKWWANIHGVKEHEVEGDWEGGGLLWEDLKVGSWFYKYQPQTAFYYYV